MAEFLTPETFEFFARYLLAGFLILSVRSRLSASRTPRPSELLFHSVILSLINQAVFLSLIAGVNTALSLVSMPEIPAATIGNLVFFAEILLFPALLGFLFGRFAGASVVGQIMRRLSMPGAHPIAEAYHFVFSGGIKRGHVILSFDDGTEIYGYFGDVSFAASDEKHSDIYLESLYVVKDGQWEIASPPRAAWISLEGIRSIEFLRQEESSNGT